MWSTSGRRLIEHLARAAVRHPGRTIAALAVVFALAFTISLVIFPKPDGRIVIGDAVHYYVYLRSAVFDGDLQFQDEYMRLYGLRGPGAEGTDWVFTALPTGYVRNMMPMGSAVVWAPLFLLTAAGASVLHLLGLIGPVDGYSRAFQASTAYSGIAAAALGAWFSYRSAAIAYDAASALGATLAVWLGSSAIYYSMVSPTYSHASSMLATSLVTFVWWRTIDVRTPRRYAAVGALAGFAALVRPQDVVFLVLPLADVLWLISSRSAGSGSLVARLRPALVNGLACGAAAALVFSPQMFVWWKIYGAPVLVPQGSGFMQWTRPHLLDVLFSTYRGLFTWTPVVLASVVGLAALARDRGRVALTLACVALLSWYINAAAADWWAGEAFGARRFLSCFPIFVVGMAALLHRLREHPAWSGSVLTALVAANLLLLLQYQVFLKGWRDIAPYPSDAPALWVARFVVPFRLAARLLGVE